MQLTDFWFITLAVLWVGYFFLEGFHLGVGMLLPVVAADEDERRVVLSTTRPVWGGNAVWLLVAGVLTVVAFPDWFATLFGAFSLPLLLIVVALVVRAVARSCRGKDDDPGRRRRWDLALFAGSAVAALLWGVVIANVVRGVPINRQMAYTGDVLGLLNAYALLGGLTTLGLFLLHGQLFLALRSFGPLRDAANTLANRTFPLVLAVVVAFLLWTQVQHGKATTAVTGAAAAAALVASYVLQRRGREGWAFALGGLTIALAVATLFLALYPDVLPSSTDPAYGLTVDNATTARLLGVLTWVAALATPVMLAYQARTYWVSRRRVGIRG